MDFLDQLKNKPDGVYKEIIPGIVFNKYGTLVQGNYAKDTLFSATWTDEQCKWRGHIYDTNLQRLVARPFEKFFNLGENGKNTLEVLENLQVVNPGSKFVYWDKLDGTMIIVYNQLETYGIATRGALTPFKNDSYPNYIKQARYLLDKDWNIKGLLSNFPNRTFVFELIWTKHREDLVTQYSEDGIYLIGMLDNDRSGIDYASFDLQEVGDNMSFLMPIRKQFFSLEECIKYAETREDQEISEGFVVTLENSTKVLHRVKVKTLQYRTMRKLISQTMPGELFEKLIDGTIYKYLETVPKELHIKVVKLLQAHSQLHEQILNEYSTICHIKDQKEFALVVQSTVPKKWHKFMFALRKGYGIDSNMKLQDLKL
jgi:RNA ligase